MEVAVLFHAIAVYLLGEEKTVPIEQDAGCVPELVWTFQRRKNL